MSKAFISYSSQDRSFVRKLVQRLHDAEVQLWFDEWEIKVGDSIVDKINEGIKSSDYLIVILSKASTRSRWVKEELSAAKTLEIHKQGVFILPVVIETCEAPPLISSKRFADFRASFSEGLQELLEVFSRTGATVSEVERYQTLESEWSNALAKVETDIAEITRLVDNERDKAFYLTDAYSEERKGGLSSLIGDTLDIYRALRPLEKSSRLASYMDGSALILAILARAHDIQLQILQLCYPKLTGVGIGVYLLIGCTQSLCCMRDESIWTFRKALRISFAMKASEEEALLGLTYHLARYAAIFNVAPEQDLAVNLLACDDREYLRGRVSQIIECYREALVREVPWHLSANANDRVSYGRLMETVGFFREALKYLERSSRDFPGHEEFRERTKTLQEAITAVESDVKHTLNGLTLHQLPTFMAEGGTRQRLDDLIQEHESEFWSEVVDGFDMLQIDEDLILRLFPEG